MATTLAHDPDKVIALCSTEWLKTLLRDLLPQVVDVADAPTGHRQAQ